MLPKAYQGTRSEKTEWPGAMKIIWVDAPNCAASAHTVAFRNGVFSSRCRAT
jgi:hypothetical protein